MAIQENGRPSRKGGFSLVEVLVASALTAFESGRDAKLILGNHVTLGIDGDGDGKIGEGGEK